MNWDPDRISYLGSELITLEPQTIEIEGVSITNSTNVEILEVLTADLSRNSTKRKTFLDLPGLYAQWIETTVNNGDNIEISILPYTFFESGSTNNNGNLDGIEDINNNGALDVISFSASEFGKGFYLTEDRNGNGKLDPDEDTIDNDRLDGGTIESGVKASVVNNRLILSSLAGGSRKIDLRDEDNILLQLGFFELNLKGLPIQKELQFDADQLLVRFPSINLNVTPGPALVEVDRSFSKPETIVPPP